LRNIESKPSSHIEDLIKDLGSPKLLDKNLMRSNGDYISKEDLE